MKLDYYSAASHQVTENEEPSVWCRIGDVYKAGRGWSVLPLPAIWLAINNAVSE